MLGKEIIRKTKLDLELAKELIEIADALKNAGETKIEDVIIGRTLCAHDFYEGIRSVNSFKLNLNETYR